MSNNNNIYSEIINQPHYIVYGDGRAVEMEHRVRNLGNIEDIARRVTESHPQTMHNIAEIGGGSVSVTVRRREGQAHRIQYATTTQLKKLKFSTRFEVIEVGDDKWLSPTFNSGRGDTSNHFSLEWVVPDGLKLFITFRVCEYLQEDDTHSAYEIINCFLHCKLAGNPADIESPMWRILPTGNVYDNSKVCFGEAFDNNQRTLIETTRSNIDLFYSTPWNADLLENRREQAINVFRFNIDTNKQLAPLGDLKDNLMTFVNNDLALYNINP